MSPVQKSLLSTVAVVVAAAAIVAGTIARDRADLHVRSFSPFATTGHSLLASLSNEPPDASASDFYEAVTALLKENYVDPITDESKLAVGGIKGMVSSLDSPDCFFMDHKEFKGFSDASMGRFEGTGAELTFQVPTQAMIKAGIPGGELVKVPAVNSTAPTNPVDAPAGEMPALTVAVVVPGSPADKAGVKAGDSVEGVNGYWVMNPYDLDRFNDISKLQKGGKISISQYLEARRDLRKKLAASMTPINARDSIDLGVTGTVKVIWNRHGQLIPTSIARAVTNEDTVRKNANGAIEVHFMAGAATHLKELVTGDAVTLDLRNNQYGDLNEMKSCLALFAPAGTYGEFVNSQGKPAKPLTIKNGHSPRKLTIIVDGSTGGVAEFFASALKAKGYAVLKGPPMSSDHNLVETVTLPDGSGYTLATGQYQSMSGRRAS